MIESTRLDGQRIALLAADGFEKVELEVPLKALRLAGATVDVISLRPGRIRGVNMHEPAGKVQVTMTVQEADPKNYEYIHPRRLHQPGLVAPVCRGQRVRPFIRCIRQAHCHHLSWGVGVGLGWYAAGADHNFVARYP